ncbi:hypothetical protein [Spirosoma telluris]|uniref:hypothetical protein n=1 Tax=Spirosoma telluris TaxID=2183553 RepID=UPI002FC29BAB
MATAEYANTQPTLANRPTILYEPGTGVGGGSFWSYEFYAKGPIVYARTDSTLRTLVQAGPKTVFTTAEYVDSLTTHGFSVHRLAIFPYYHVSQLTYDFLNPATRSKTLLPYVLVEVK